MKVQIITIPQKEMEKSQDQYKNKVGIKPNALEK